MKRGTRLLLGAIALIVLFNGTIRLANDGIAGRLEEKLLAYPLPEGARLADSIAIAGKLEGNGNGMQYRGALLLETELSEEELYAHYWALEIEDSFLEVAPQEEARLYEYYDHRFDGWQEGGHYYRVMLLRDSVAGAEDSFIEGILNMDLRGH